MNKIKKNLFFEDYHLKEKKELITIKNENITQIQKNSFDNHAIRIITEERKEGFHVSTSDLKLEVFAEKAHENAISQVKDLPSRENNFAQNDNLYEDTTNGYTQNDIKELLYGNNSPLKFFDSLITIQKSTQEKKITNSFEASAYHKLKTLSFSIELRESVTQRLLMLNQVDINHLKEFRNFLAIVAKLPLVKSRKLSNINGFILSPNIVSELLYPIQNLILQGVVVTKNINKSISLVETTQGLFSIPFDDEGVRTNNKIIFGNGEFISNNFSTLTNGNSTGNGFRKDYRRKPALSPLVWEMKPGKYKISELMNQAKKQIFIENISQGYVDTYSGNYIANVMSSYLIEDGEFKGILPSFKIVLDPVAILEDTHLLISKKTEFTDDSMYKLPYFYTENVIIFD